MAAVVTKNVVKRYGSMQVLHGLDIEIADGEFTVLIGPSGCGKSTLLRMIAGLEDITSGEVVIGGKVVNDLAPKQRDIAMVFQSYALYPHMTVYQNMGFSLMLAKAPKDVINTQVRQAAQVLGLTELLDRHPRQLSGGQRQRVAMGRAIVRSPQVFLFDEPLSNLDAKLRVQMRTELKELHQRFKTTSIYVTHDQIEAMTLADRIVVLRDGKIEQTGSPLELYDAPANTFVAGFIGSPAMNLLEGVFVRQGDRQGIDLKTAAFIPCCTDSAARDGQQVVVGIRPEYFRLSSEGSGLAAKVTVVEPTGADIQVICKIGSYDIVSVFHERHQFVPGELIWLEPRADKLHVFDAQTGSAIR
ncbi:MAG TPA: sugar ABC transporter ATP-binding protein [Advenella kashmirensis]|uniref:Sugar ABC transporter ATP-binding protein n=1 Tax=Advenella kashmirensis TaxID=310575 RepID=A0A356LDP9_9BURK|nr:sugar ABC transporter ATP-binding protein [Advenella kashmirensis]